MSIHRQPLAWLAALVGSALVMLAPALWNGFPFMFYDSGAFIDLAARGGFMPERSAFYGVFLSAFRPSLSLWPAMVAQVAMTVLVMTAFARILAPGLSPARLLIIVVALCISTGLPWDAAEVLPDIMAPLLVLTLYLLAFHSAVLGWAQRLALIAVAILATVSHASHLALAGGLAVVIALIQLATRRVNFGTARPRWRLPAVVFVLSLASVVTSNFVRTGEVFISRSGPAFVLGRLIKDGIVERVLDDTCPQSGYRLCAYKGHLPADGNDYLWAGNSPFNSLGGFTGTADESRRIIVESLKRYPLLHLKMAISNTVEQFVSFKTGDSIEPLNDVPVPALTRNMPQLVDAYRASRQQNDAIDFRGINAVQVPVGALSIIVLAAILAQAARRRLWNDRLFLPVFILVALTGNAFVCGALSSPHDRYQSRLIWAATFAVLCLLQNSGVKFRLMKLAGKIGGWDRPRHTVTPT
jgi:hypothetical protein